MPAGSGAGVGAVASVTVMAYGAGADSVTVTTNDVGDPVPPLPSSFARLATLTVGLSLSAIVPVCETAPLSVYELLVPTVRMTVSAFSIAWSSAGVTVSVTEATPPGRSSVEPFAASVAPLLAVTT